MDINNQIVEEVRSALYSIGQAVRETEMERQMPHVLMRPKLFLDGNQWCALYGENLQEGVVGFGDSPYLAMCEFDNAWFKKLK